MEKNDWDRVGAKVVDIEMCLMLQKNHLEELEGQCKEMVGKMITELGTHSDALQEIVCVNRNAILQQTLINSIEVVGLPQDTCENTDDVADVLSQILQTHIEEHNIRGFETIDEFAGPDLGQEGPEKVDSQILLVHLIDRHLRDFILNRGQTSRLCYPGSGRVYIYEHLTHMNRQIFHKARQEAIRLKIQNVWIADGRIYVRRNPTSQIHQIRCDSDIQNMENI